MKHSPIESEHLRLGARMVPFAGWSMPVQYASITEEHLAVRRGAGVFDISHMGQFFVTGTGAQPWLNRMLTNNVANLRPGEGQYTLLLNERGGVIDDLIIYNVSEGAYFLVVNASMVVEDEACLRRQAPSDVRLENRSAGQAGLAVQGPRAPQLLDHLPPRNGIKVGGSVLICRTGYTGEDGFELFCPAEAGPGWFRRFVDAGATPCGLGARDTLRLEMCYPLNGADLSPDRTPFESGLAFFVDMDKGDFVGRSALEVQKAAGGHDRLCALRLTAKGPPPRAHYGVFAGAAKIGELTSGGVAPSLDGAGIGLAYIKSAFAKPGTPVEIDIRGRRYPAETVKKPFYQKGGR